MCNNSKREVFPLQFIITTVSIYTYLTVVSNGRFEALWGKMVIVFIMKRINLIEQNNMPCDATVKESAAKSNLI